MSRFRNILLVQVPGGDSDDALRRARELARRDDARLTVLSAVGKIPALPSASTGPLPEIDLEALVLDECRERLEQRVEPLRRDGLAVETVVRVGTPFVAIIREVLRHGHDLVVKTAEGPRGAWQRLFGTTALHLVRKCPCPVWIVRSSGGERTGRVLAAVDPSPDDDPLSPGDEHFRVNEKILRTAATVARLDSAELVVVHAWALYGETLLRGRGRVPGERVDDLAEETGRRHRRQVEELVARQDLSDLEVRLELVKGEAGEVLPAVAEHERADLLVMGSVGRTGLAGMLIGNTAETVLGRVDCSVLTVKPDGFVTPVSPEDPN